MTPRTQLVVGVAGGSGSGKTTFARSLVHRLPEGTSVIIDHDSYYRSQAAVDPDTDFDHPDALETSLLCAHLRELKAGRSIARPLYDFKCHRRVGSKQVAPMRVVIVEGILVLHEEPLRELFDFGFFVDTPADIRLARRIARDVKERGRTLEGTLAQYLRTVRPAYEQFVAPSRAHADLVVPGQRGFTRALAIAAGAIRSALDASQPAVDEQQV